MKFSIIVPVYNVQDYLDRCITSILNQTFTNFEVVLIDDGSTDKSGEICDFYLKDKRVKVLHKENGGVSSARNCGLKNANGERIVFIDADDYVDNDLLMKLSESECDAINYVNKEEFFKESYGEGNSFEINFLKESSLDYITRGIRQGIYELWRTCFKNDLIKQYGLKFNESINCGEDLMFFCNYMAICKNVCVLNYMGYHYTVRENSIMTTKKGPVGDVGFDAMNYNALDIYSFYKANNLYMEKFYILHYELMYKSLNFGWYYHLRDIKRHIQHLRVTQQKEFYIKNIKKYYKDRKQEFNSVEAFKVETQKKYLMLFAGNRNYLSFYLKYFFLQIKVLFERLKRKIKNKEYDKHEK